VSGNLTVDTNTLFVDATNDRVGIGTTSPATLLTISGSTPTFTMNRVAAGSYPKISFTDTTTEYGYIQSSAATGIIRYDIGPSAGWGGIHSWFVDQSERMRLTSTGLGVFTTSLSASAILQADSTTQGFLPPRMTTSQKNAISSPVAGLIVYDTTLNKLCVRTASTWETITSL
jgi:hypothetical protein